MWLFPKDKGVLRNRSLEDVRKVIYRLAGGAEGSQVIVRTDDERLVVRLTKGPYAPSVSQRIDLTVSSPRAGLVEPHVAPVLCAPDDASTRVEIDSTEQTLSASVDGRQDTLARLLRDAVGALAAGLGYPPDLTFGVELDLRYDGRVSAWVGRESVEQATQSRSPLRRWLAKKYLQWIPDDGAG